MNDMFLDTLCNRSQEAERKAAELFLHARSILAETKTSRRDFVTEYDRRVQEMLTQKLREVLPDAHFFCEEMNEQDGLDAEHLFVIDPIDGTMNFVRGLHHSCISVAYVNRGTVCIGAIYNPYVDEMFTAIRGRGALLNGRAIHVADTRLSESVVCFGTSPYAPALQARSVELAGKLLAESLDLRREGSAALDLCSVAAGRAGLYFELQLSLWDYAAGELIVREAGGLCSRVDGSPLPFDSSKPDVLAGCPAAISDFFSRIV